MTGKFGGINTGPDAFNRKIRDLEKQVKANQSGRRMQAATIGDGGVTIEGNGNLTVQDGGDVAVFSGGNVEVYDGGLLRVWGPDSIGTMTAGEFGVATLTAGQITHPKTYAKPGGFLVTPASGTGYASYGVETSGAASIASEVNRTFVGHQTTSATANANLQLSGEILRSTSSLRYKQDVEDAPPIDDADVLAMRLRSWRDRAEVERGEAEGVEVETRYTGYIAEELHRLPSLRQFVLYDAEGRPDAIAYDRLNGALLSLAQSQARQIAELSDRLTALTEKVDALTTLPGGAL